MGAAVRIAPTLFPAIAAAASLVNNPNSRSRRQSTSSVATRYTRVLDRGYAERAEHVDLVLLSCDHALRAVWSCPATGLADEPAPQAGSGLDGVVGVMTDPRKQPLAEHDVVR